MLLMLILLQLLLLLPAGRLWSRSRGSRRGGRSRVLLLLMPL
jgi:hypothetical protein